MNKLSENNGGYESHGDGHFEREVSTLLCATKQPQENGDWKRASVFVQELTSGFWEISFERIMETEICFYMKLRNELKWKAEGLDHLLESLTHEKRKIDWILVKYDHLQESFSVCWLVLFIYLFF